MAVTGLIIIKSPKEMAKKQKKQEAVSPRSRKGRQPQQKSRVIRKATRSRKRP